MVTNQWWKSLKVMGLGENRIRWKKYVKNEKLTKWKKTTQRTEITVHLYDSFWFVIRYNTYLRHYDLVYVDFDAYNLSYTDKVKLTWFLLPLTNMLSTNLFHRILWTPKPHNFYNQATQCAIFHTKSYWGNLLDRETSCEKIILGYFSVTTAFIGTFLVKLFSDFDRLAMTIKAVAHTPYASYFFRLFER